MKITKDQLKQIIKEEIEDSLMDEGVLDIAKNIGARAIGAVGRGGKASSQGRQEVEQFFDKQFLDLVNNTPKPASDPRLDFSDSYAGLPKELSDEEKNTIIAANRLAAYVIHNEPGSGKLLSKMRTGVGAYIYGMGLARKKKIAPNFKKGEIPKNITINNAEDMRLAITILEYGYSAFNKTKAKFAANTTQMFNRVLAPDNLFKKMTVDIQKELEDFYQTRVSGRTIGQARHDTVVGIGAYLVDLRSEVANNKTSFDRVMKPFAPKRQLNKALEESKAKITKTQLKQIIKEELEASLAEAKLKDFIKTGKIHSSIPSGSLTRVLAQNPKLSKMATNAANPRGQAQAFEEIARLLADERDIKRAIGDEPLEKHLDVKGFLRYAEKNMPYVFEENQQGV